MSQTFETDDGKITVHVEARLGRRGEIWSVAVTGALIRVETQAQTDSILVVGDAGC